jgi:anti-sigma factor RsiW
MTYQTPIADSDLQAYVDDRLSPARRREVEAYLSDHPAVAVQVEELKALGRTIHRLYDPVLEEPLPPEMAISPNRAVWVRRLAAAAAMLVLGAVIGWWLKPSLDHTVTVRLYDQLVRPAAFAHRVYATDPRRPVELKARDEQQLINWLSARMHTQIKAPNLAPAGFELIGGRLLPSTDRMAAQFMYQDGHGQRLTLYIRRGAWTNQTPAFQYSRSQGIGTLYWIDGPMGYALSGDFAKTTLLRLSDRIYRQLKGATANQHNS